MLVRFERLFQVVSHFLTVKLSFRLYRDSGNAANIFYLLTKHLNRKKKKADQSEGSAFGLRAQVESFCSLVELPFLCNKKSKL